MMDKLQEWFVNPTFFLVITMGGGIGMGLWFYIQRKCGLGKAQLLSIMVVDNQVLYSGSLYYQTRGWIYHTRVETLDAQTGAKKRKVVLYFNEHEIALVSNGIIWTSPSRKKDDHKRVYEPVGLNLTTLETTYDKKGIEQYLNFKADEHLTEIKTDADKSQVLFVSNLGNAYPINYAKTSAIREGVIPAHSASSSFYPHNWAGSYSCSKKDGSDRYQLFRDKKSIGTESFIEPRWIHDYYESDKLKGVILYYLQTLDTNPFVSISLLTMDGKLQWTVKQQALAIRPKVEHQRNDCTTITYAGSSSNLFIYAVSGPLGDRKIIGVDKDDGRVSWQVPI